MPKPGTTIEIRGVTATVDNQGEWTITSGPKDIIEWMQPLLATLSRDTDYSPADGEPSAAYAQHVIDVLKTGKIVKITMKSVPPDAVA